MIAPNRDGDSGGLGGNLRPEGTRDTRLLERAVKQRWPIPDDYRQPIVDRMYHIATTSDSAREASVAARVLVSMEQQNQADQLKVIDKSVPDLHEVTGAVEHRHTTQELLEHPEYVEWLRERERNSDPRTICQNGHQGNGSALDDGPSRNGH